MNAPFRPAEVATETITFAEAVRRALHHAMASDPRVIVFGEGAHDAGAVFGTQAGLLDAFGPYRVIEMPTAEVGIVGAAVGAAMAGKRPVVSFHRVEFALLAMEQIVNVMAKMRWASNGRHSVPLLIRLVVGRGWGQGPVHAQSLEALFGAVPGLRVAVPSTPADAAGMVTAALRGDDPTILIEHRWCHDMHGFVPDDAHLHAFDGPRPCAFGAAATIVAFGYMTVEALRAAKTLHRLGYPCDLFDLRVVRPLNLAQVIESVKRTGRLLVVDSGHRLYGVGSEIVAQVATECHGLLRNAPCRLSLPDHPVPSSRFMINGYYPDAALIFRTAHGMFDLGLNEQLDAGALEDELRPTGAIDQRNTDFTGPF